MDQSTFFIVNPGINDLLEALGFALTNNALGKVCDGLIDLVFYFSGIRGNGVFITAVHGPGQGIFAQNHIGVLNEIFVYAGFTIADFNSVGQTEPVPNLLGTVLFPKYNDIRANLCACIFFKGRTGQAHGPDKIGLFPQSLADTAIAHGIQGVMGSNAHHQAPGPNKINGFAKEIIMNAPFAVFWKYLVHNRVFTKWEVGDNQIHRVLGHAPGFFKSSYLDVCFRVELRQYPAGEGIKFNAMKNGPLCHTLWYETKEMPHTCRWLQDMAALESKLLN